MMKESNKVLLISFMLVLSLFFLGCGGNVVEPTDDQNTPDTGGNSSVYERPAGITIAYIAMANMSPQAAVAPQEQIFEKALADMGVSVNWVLTRSLDNIWPMMDGEEVDFVYLPAQNMATYITETSEFGGSDLFRVIAGSLENNSFTLMVQPGITSLRDLDGKTVGVVNHFYFEEAMLNKQLEKAGLKTTAMGGTVKVEYQDVMIHLHENFESKQYDAITAWNTMVGAVKKRVPEAKVLLNLNEGETFGPRHPQKWLVGRKVMLDRDPELVKAVLEAHLAATESALSKAEELPMVAKERYDDYFVNTLKAQDYPDYPNEYYQSMWEDALPVYDPNLSFVREIYDFMVSAGYVKGKTIEQFVDVTLLNEVLAEKGMVLVK